MSPSRNSARQRLIQAALELFAVQGVTETTTRQIAEQAGVNEVTLFRNFGSKYGLLFAVIEEGAVFTRLGRALVHQMPKTSRLEDTIRDYAYTYLRGLERVPNVVRSVIGEAGNYPDENRAALGRGITQTNRAVADYFKHLAERERLDPRFSPEILASLLNSLLLGYAVIELTSDAHQLWHSRDEFVSHLTTLFLRGAVSDRSLEASVDHEQSRLAAPSNAQRATPSGTLIAAESSDTVADLPAGLVHEILQRAKKRSAQDYAIAYVLFGAGLSSQEIVQLERSHHISDRNQNVLHVTQGRSRHVPINQWIMGKRYGTVRKNPLTQWLKSRKDDLSALFLNADETQPLSDADLRQLWQGLTHDLTTSEGRSPTLEQAQQTWCVEMFMRGMTVENMQILTGWGSNRLDIYVQRAKEKAALEQAMRLDQKL